MANIIQKTGHQDTSVADVRKRGGPRIPPANPTKEGEWYDRCPVDACIEVDRFGKIGGRDNKGQDHLDAAFYNARRELGGCGSNWIRSTKEGAARAAKRGVKAKWLTKSATTGRLFTDSSVAYQDNYLCAFQKCGCPIHTPMWAANEARAGCNAACAGHVIWQDRLEPVQ